MRQNRDGFIKPLPYEIYEQIKDFRDSYDEIINYHIKFIEPEIRTKGMDIVHVCQLLARCVNDENFEVYKRYAVLAPEAYEVLSMFYSSQAIQPGDLFVDTLEKQGLLPLDMYIDQPIAHLKKYEQLMRNNVSVVIESPELSKIVANVVIQFSNYQRRVEETYKIHRKRSLVVI